MRNNLSKIFFAWVFAVLINFFASDRVFAYGCCYYSVGENCGTYRPDFSYLQDKAAWHDIHQAECEYFKGEYYRDATCEYDENGRNGRCVSVNASDEEIEEAVENEENPEKALGDGTVPSDEESLPESPPGPEAAAPVKKTTEPEPKKEWCPPGKFCLQVPFPGSDAIEKAVGAKEDVLLTYIKVFFQFAVWLSITLAIFMMMVAGFLYLTAGGDAGKVTQAKEYISNSIMGVVLALLSFLILQGINPRLVRLSLPEIPEIPTVGTGGTCCYNAARKDVVYVNLIGEKKDASGKTTASAQTCEQALSLYYGTGWKECQYTKENPACCVCDTRTASESRDDFDTICWSNIPADEFCESEYLYSGSTSCRVEKTDCAGIKESKNKEGKVTYTYRLCDESKILEFKLKK